MSVPMRLLNVKVSEDLRALVERATEVSESADMSKWVREALEAGARAELARHERTVAASTHLKDGGPDAHDGVPVSPSRVIRCIHPSTARRSTVEADVCGMCGLVTRWRL